MAGSSYQLLATTRCRLSATSYQLVASHLVAKPPGGWRLANGGQPLAAQPPASFGLQSTSHQQPRKIVFFPGGTIENPALYSQPYKSSKSWIRQIRKTKIHDSLDSQFCESEFWIHCMCESNANANGVNSLTTNQANLCESSGSSESSIRCESKIGGIHEFTDYWLLYLEIRKQDTFDHHPPTHPPTKLHITIWTTHLCKAFGRTQREQQGFIGQVFQQPLVTIALHALPSHPPYAIEIRIVRITAEQEREIEKLSNR